MEGYILADDASLVPVESKPEPPRESEPGNPERQASGSRDVAVGEARELTGDEPKALLVDKPQTLTKIIFEQLEHAVELRYGSRFHVLWRGTSKKECEETMREMGQIIEDCLQRLRVDFNDSDLHMAMEAMNIRSWAGATGEKSLFLRSKARRLCEAVGLVFSRETWREAIRHVERTRRRRQDSDTVDNRLLWVTALEASQGQQSPLKEFGPLIAFYVAITDGTGNVERLLGMHASFLEHHVGAPDSDMSEVCLEVAREGPRTEEEIFTKDRQRPGVLLFTDWSRRCAQLWRGLHGRRFACYKERVDKGKRHTGLRWHGSMKAVARMQESATKALVKMAREDDVARAAEEGERPRPTVVGIERGKLMRRAQMREVAAPTKALLNFRKTTATRKDMKSKASTWAGFGKRPPPKCAGSRGSVGGQYGGNPKVGIVCCGLEVKDCEVGIVCWHSRAQQSPIPSRRAGVQSPADLLRRVTEARCAKKRVWQRQTRSVYMGSSKVWRCHTPSV